MRLVTSSRCQPNCVFTGPCTVPTGQLKTTRSNSGTIWPGRNSPRSPPCLPEGHCECCRARSPKSAPDSICVFRSSQASFVLTRICRAFAFLATGHLSLLVLFLGEYVGLCRVGPASL